MRIMVLAVLGTLCSSRGLAQLEGSQSYAVVEGVNFASPDPGPAGGVAPATNQFAPIEIRLRNVSPKDITYVGFTVPLIYSDGTERLAPNRGTDFIYPLRAIEGAGNDLKPKGDAQRG